MGETEFSKTDGLSSCRWEAGHLGTWLGSHPCAGSVRPTGDPRLCAASLRRRTCLLGRLVRTRRPFGSRLAPPVPCGPSYAPWAATAPWRCVSCLAGVGLAVCPPPSRGQHLVTSAQVCGAWCQHRRLPEVLEGGQQGPDWDLMTRWALPLQASPARPSGDKDAVGGGPRPRGGFFRRLPRTDLGSAGL